MHLYISAKQTPELLNLDHVQQGTVLQQAYKVLAREKPRLRWLPTCFCFLGGTFAWLTVPFLLGMVTESSLDRSMYSMGMVVLCGLAGGTIGKQILIWRLRPYLHKCRKGIIAEDGKGVRKGSLLSTMPPEPAADQ
jgi:hypothetical protein